MGLGLGGSRGAVVSALGVNRSFSFNSVRCRVFGGSRLAGGSEGRTVSGFYSGVRGVRMAYCSSCFGRDTVR